MENKLLKLFLLVVVFFGAPLISCDKGPYSPEVLGEDEYSGAGYARNFQPGNGDLTFIVDRKSGGSETLAVRGSGNTQADILVNGQHYELTFSQGVGKWEIATVNVSLNSGLNSICISRKGSGQGSLRIDYIEIH